MKKLITICLLLAMTFTTIAQTRKEMHDYITSFLSYKSVEYELMAGITSTMAVDKINFSDCEMNFKIFEKHGDDVDSYIITIPFTKVNKIEMGKNALEFYVIDFSTQEKIIKKKYKNGNIEYNKLLSLPLEYEDKIALDYFKKLNMSCK